MILFCRNDLATFVIVVMIGANGKRRAIWLFSFRYIAGKFSHFVDVPIQIYDKALSTVMDHFECKSTSKPTYYSVTAFIVLYLRDGFCG